MKKLMKLLTSLSVCTALIFSGCASSTAETAGQIIAYQVSDDEGFDLYSSETDEPEVIENVMTDDEIALIALVTMAEAEDESEEGKRLVIDTILNRIDSEEFPDTVYGVIFEPYQFPSMTNGRVERCEVRDDICRLVREELQSRYNYDCVFFRAEDYSEYGTPLFQVGNHYFSSEEDYRE